jgi:phosphoribosylaminoimidazole-succinocarboxamide synthase
MGLASAAELEKIASYSMRINEILREYLASAGIELVDFKVEYGRLPDGTIILADEISPDTCRFWDAKTGMKLDKDRFRRDLGGVEEAYDEVRKRLLGA